MHDYYAILELSSTATTAEIKRAYRRLARKYHPDLNRQALDNHIKLLNEAYAVLRDPAKRAKYDALRAQEAQRLAAERERRRKQAQAKKEAEMTWAEGMVGFVRELKKALQEE